MDQLRDSHTHGQPSHPMDEVRILHLAVGPSIKSVVMPTLKIFAPHLLMNKERIESIQRRSEKFGSHVRHELDIYEPQDGDTGTGPILVYFYGGGLVRGDKILAEQELVYHNLGAFFALQGITTIIPDYRRVNSPSGGEEATYPSGAEDVSLSLEWLAKSPLVGKGKRELFIMGNSAGGVHVSTFMFEPRFLEQRKQLIHGNTGLIWKGVIELGVPFHFKGADQSRAETLKLYYGSIDAAEGHTPYGLLEALVKARTPREEVYIPKILALVGQYDPPDEIYGSMTDFVELSEKTWGAGVELVELEGHNHISPPPALMSGCEKSEKWGRDVVQWIMKEV